jgi:hypothetical protein
MHKNVAILNWLMGSPLDKSMDGSLTTIQIQDNIHRFASNKKRPHTITKMNCNIKHILTDLISIGYCKNEFYIAD